MNGLREVRTEKGPSEEGAPVVSSVWADPSLETLVTIFDNFDVAIHFFDDFSYIRDYFPFEDGLRIISIEKCRIFEGCWHLNVICGDSYDTIITQNNVSIKTINFWTLVKAYNGEGEMPTPPKPLKDFKIEWDPKEKKYHVVLETSKGGIYTFWLDPKISKISVEASGPVKVDMTKDPIFGQLLANYEKAMKQKKEVA